MEYFIEFRSWGLNPVTISFLGTLIMGYVFGYGLYKQAKAIKDAGSGLSVSIPTNIYFTFHFFAFAVYGLRWHSLAMILNGLLGVLWLWVYFTASKYPDSTGRKPWHLALALLPITMFFTDYAQLLMSAMYVSATVFLFDSPIEIYRKKDAGSVSLSYLVCFVISAVFWATFSSAIGDWPLFTANITGIAIMSVTIYLWLKYKKRVVQAPPPYVAEKIEGKLCSDCGSPNVTVTHSGTLVGPGEVGHFCYSCFSIRNHDYFQQRPVRPLGVRSTYWSETGAD